MANQHEQHHRSPRDVPPVGRPKGSVWRSLQADGVVWEGQVLLVGGKVDLAARMIVTHRRVVFVRGGDAVLEIPRGWLRQEPVLRRDGVLELFVATPESNPFDEPMPVRLRMREGHPAAGHIIAMLAPGGVRRITPDSVSAIERARDAAPTPTYGGFWDGVDPVPSPNRDDFSSSTRYLSGSGAIPDETLDDLPPLEPPDRLVRASSSPRRQPNIPAYTIAGLAPRDQRRSSWSLVLRICALIVLLGAAAALGAGRLDIPMPGSGPSAEAVLTAPPATDSAESVDAAPVASVASEQASDAANTALSPDELTAIAIGVGGSATQPTPEAATSNEAPVQPATTATAVPVIASNETAIPTPASVVDAPVSTETDEVEPEAAPADAESEPEAASAPETSTDTAVQSTAPDDGAARSAAEQPAAVTTTDMPAQEIVVGSVRMAIPTALRDESLPKYGLPPGEGEWVLLIAELTNEGSDPATIAMSDFRVFDRGSGRVADLDSGVGVIATLAGIVPSRNAAESIVLDPGVTTKTLLLYLLPPGSSDDLALLIGNSSLDLAASISAGGGEPAASPELLEATVTDVHDGNRITVDIDGLSRVVHYLGVQAPITEACFATEAAAANKTLVEGKTVWLERQATDVGADGELMRDVWVADGQGQRILVAARLLEEGAARVHSVAPDTRYQSWLSAASAFGRSNGAGLWTSCPDAGAASESAAADQLAYLPQGWRARFGLTTP